jgi:hypothetical protein
MCTMLQSQTARAGARSSVVKYCKCVFHLVALTILRVIDIMTLGYSRGRTLVKNNFAHAATRTEDGH